MKILAIISCVFIPTLILAQTRDTLPEIHAGLKAGDLKSVTQDEWFKSGNLPVFSMLLNGETVKSDAFIIRSTGDSIVADYEHLLRCIVRKIRNEQYSSRLNVRFLNQSETVLTIENVVPFGVSADHVYITADGTKEWPQYLCRTRIYRPNYAPVGIVLPDNVWHMGWSDLKIAENMSVSALCRRYSRQNADIDRWSSVLKPGGYQDYTFYYEKHQGDWKQGLDLVFRQRYLYDLDTFNNSLFKRTDLSWMRNTYLMVLKFAWDKTWNDPVTGANRFYDELTRYDNLTGGWDIFTLWPTWPRLGLDERNQFDLYRDLPGGLKELKKQSEFSHKLGKKYFISYNPWDESTRHEEHLSGLETLLRETDADGVVLDCKGESSYELQAAADKVKQGIIMYSEGMAVPKDMPGIVAGRVHNALYMPPPVNMNKFIKPDFAIFRVIDLADYEIHREICISFFNGYGIEINTMRQGRPANTLKELEFAGKTTRILRENTTAFHDMAWQPFVETLTDSIWVNQWNDGSKRIFTIFSLKPEGFNGPLFQSSAGREAHWIDLWNHTEAVVSESGEKKMIHADIAAFNRSWIGTRKEGSIGCVARFEKLLECTLSPDSVKCFATRGDEIKIWAGNPCYTKTPFVSGMMGCTISLVDHFPEYEDKFVVQLLEQGELIDEQVLLYLPGTPRLVSAPKFSDAALKTPEGMVEIPSYAFTCVIKRDSLSQDPFISLPDYSHPRTRSMKRFFMDKYPVTNAQFYVFIKESGYQPVDSMNFLKHWANGKPPIGKENHPVVFISLEDARAYAKWVGKRLPSEIEWQYAAQGMDGRKFPWGNSLQPDRCNNGVNSTTPVDKYPKGKSPFGVCDLIGNVWQMTDDEYDNGSYRYNIIRGGSFYHPENSIWYMTGGPVPVYHPEILIRVSPSLDRCSTVGFRCVKDAL